MIVMGIDASTTSTGWSIFKDKELVDYGCIKPLGDDWRERLIDEGPELKKIVEKYHPEIVYMEDVPLKGKILKTLVILGAVQGFLYGVFSSLHVKIEFLLPSKWRSDIGLFDGTKDGTKRDIMKEKAIEKANKLFGLKLKYVSPKSLKNEDDTAEAILIAYSQIVKHNVRNLRRPKSQ